MWNRATVAVAVLAARIINGSRLALIAGDGEDCRLL
jgi:hypothetical protein